MGTNLAVAGRCASGKVQNLERAEKLGQSTLIPFGLGTVGNPELQLANGNRRNSDIADTKPFEAKYDPLGRAFDDVNEATAAELYCGEYVTSKSP